jgi:hypothetical protein
VHHRCIRGSALRDRKTARKQPFEDLRVDVIGHDQMRVDVEAHRGSGVPGAFRELPRRHALEVPQGDPAMPQAMRSNER